MKWTALANGFGKDILAARTKMVIRDEVQPATATDSRQFHAAFAALLENMFLFYRTHFFLWSRATGSRAGLSEM